MSLFCGHSIDYVVKKEMPNTVRILRSCDVVLRIDRRVGLSDASCPVCDLVPLKHILFQMIKLCFYYFSLLCNGISDLLAFIPINGA